jgi:hypothetical protein
MSRSNDEIPQRGNKGAMENMKPMVEDEPLWVSKMRSGDRQKAREVALAIRDQVMRNLTKSGIPPEEPKKEEEPSPEQMLQADAELQACLDQIRGRLEEIEVKAPGSSKHRKLLQSYLGQMDERILKGLKANFAVSLKTIDIQEKNIGMLKDRITQLEEISESRRLRIAAMEIINKSLGELLEEAYKGK